MCTALLPVTRKGPLPAPREREVIVPEIVEGDDREYDCIVERVRVVEIERVYIARKVA